MGKSARKRISVHMRDLLESPFLAILQKTLAFRGLAHSSCTVASRKPLAQQCFHILRFPVLTCERCRLIPIRSCSFLQEKGRICAVYSSNLCSKAALEPGER
jgi:hypothetical protein